MIKAIIFDCYGVLVTDGWLPFKHEKFGNNPELMQEASDLSNQHNLGIISTDEFIKELAGISKQSPKEVSGVVYSNKSNAQLFEYISELKSKYKIGMLTNMAGDALRELFSKDQLGYFDYTALSCEIGFVKPDPRSYQIVASMLDVDIAECIMIDDLQRNCTAAEEVGMKSVWYQNFDQMKTELNKLLNTKS